jgi:outer membrane biosynthesis protein TonB
MNSLSILTLISMVACVVACGGSEPAAMAPTSTTETAATAKNGAAPAGAGEGLPIPGADNVVAAMRPDFRACYNDGLKKNPKLEGSVLVEAKVGPKGEVTSSMPTDMQGLTPEVADCIAKRVKAATFSPPGEKGSTLKIPVNFKAGS